MLGAIIGDIVGSVYEWDNIKTKDFPLFRDDCFFTDDTVMTVAVADALMQSEASTYGGINARKSLYVTPGAFIESMKKWGCLYPDSGYGARFSGWLFSDSREPYNSWGNGSAMRVSPCGWIVPIQQSMRKGFDETRDLAKRSAEVTHNHPEGIKGAEATAAAIFLCRSYFSGRWGDYGNDAAEPAQWKAKIKKVIEDTYGYDLSRTLDEIRPAYRFNESCHETVPEAIIAFLESTDFEDAIRNAISLGGDSDTLAAITGSIAEAAYGIPKDIKEKALRYLDTPIREVCGRWYGMISEQHPAHQSL